jgi:hypothetical protein
MRAKILITAMAVAALLGAAASTAVAVDAPGHSTTDRGPDGKKE